MPNPSMIDFGAFRRERRERLQGRYSKPIVLNINEVPEDHPDYDPKKVYTLPAVMSGMAVLELQRVRREHGDEVPNEEIYTLGEAVFPPEILRSLTQYCGLDFEELGELILVVVAEYGKRMDEYAQEEPEGNAERPKTKGRRSTSSKTGRSSKRTSKESTE